ncbi:hypothetical protein LC085_21405 [Bacillus tianshenii]|uniref:tetratricopeptide repeat protein n=1 Tax=Sutcliffiella tianshenii TaxID=1463404 RepID=UPI001CD312BD|nr:hypothetical protein [Bacillus tianshenii]MCA1322436.1 hypothetical protein [Bacillus tianshenii]
MTKLDLLKKFIIKRNLDIKISKPIKSYTKFSYNGFDAGKVYNSDTYKISIVRGTKAERIFRKRKYKLMISKDNHNITAIFDLERKEDFVQVKTILLNMAILANNGLRERINYARDSEKIHTVNRNAHVENNFNQNQSEIHKKSSMQDLIDYLNTQEKEYVYSVDSIDALADEVMTLNKIPDNYNKIIEIGWKLTDLLTSKIKIEVDIKEISGIIVSAHIDHYDIINAIKWLDEMAKWGYEFPHINNKLMEIKKLQNGFHIENITDNQTLNSIARLYKDLKAYNKAKSILERALELKPNSTYSLTQLGGIYRKLKMYAEGKMQYEKSLKLLVDKHALNGLGGIYRDIADYDNALKCYHSAIELDESDKVTHTGIGAVYIDLKDYETADSHFQMAGLNTIKYLEKEYSMLIREKSFEIAIDCLKQILDIDPNNTRAKKELDYMSKQVNDANRALLH